MKKSETLILAALLIAFSSIVSTSKAGTKTKEQAVDTVMQHVFTYASKNRLHVGHFDNIVYTKFHIDSHIRNFTIKLIPNSFNLERGNNHILGENVTRYNYVDFGIVSRKEVAFYSSMKKLRKIPDILHSNVNAMIYEPTIYVDNLLSPFNKTNRRYYNYSIDSTRHVDGATQVLVSFTPKYGNTQLVRGKAWVDYDTGKVEKMVFEAVYDNILHVKASLVTGKNGILSLLPDRTFIEMNYKLGGNSVSISLNSKMNYIRADSRHYADSIGFYTSKNRYDITRLDLIPYDTAHVIRTKSYFDDIRPFQLTYAEDSIYSANRDSIKTYGFGSDTTRHNSFNTSSLEDILLSRHKVSFSNNTTLAVPAVFTPSMFQWSGSRGISLQARLQLNVDFPDGRLLKLTPRIGYSFRQNQIYWKVPVDFLVFPKIGGGIEANIRNGNHIYSSIQAREVRKQLKKFSSYDSMLNVFNKYNFNYYDDFQASAAFYIEPVVGLKMHSGLTFHQRNLINWNNVASAGGMKRYYKSIAPFINLEYTPALYYRRAANRRIPLHTYWPTFRMSYEKGVRWWTCDNKYERWECDASYRINLRALSSIYLRAGGGLFTDRKEMYFVDYENFSFQNMPTGWEDDMFGVFQLLDRRWYNESNYYTLLCAAYESPHLLITRAPLVSKVIKKERLYINSVSLHALNAYIEGGYGISTNFFDGAVFIGGGNASGIEFGAKISLRFFDRW